MGMGDWPAGSTLAGFDVSTSTKPVLPMSAGALYDPTLRVIVVNADGTVGAMHYVDQQVVFALTIALKSIPAAPDIGTDRERIRRALPRNVPLTVQDVVQNALAALVNAKAITLDRIEVRAAQLGKTAYRVFYTNLVAASGQSHVDVNG